MNAEQLRVVIAALYARGGPGGGSGAASPAPAMRAQAVIRHLREAAPASLQDVPRALERVFCWEEASVLRYVGRTDWAHELVERSMVLTSACSGYPRGWAARFGLSAIPVVFQRGGAFIADHPAVSVVGCRHLSEPESSFSFCLGQALAGLGFGVVSGGARGADSEACRGAVEAARIGDADGARYEEIVPFGLESSDDPWAGSSGPNGGHAVSAAALGARFRTALAMERNALLYARGVGTIIVTARFGGGGTWHGAKEALRRRLGPVAIWTPDDPSVYGSDKSEQELRLRAARALAALGANPVRSIDEAARWAQSMATMPLPAPPASRPLRGGPARYVAEPSLWPDMIAS